VRSTTSWAKPIKNNCEILKKSPVLVKWQCGADVYVEASMEEVKTVNCEFVSAVWREVR
jgi:hypothetical protein